MTKTFVEIIRRGCHPLEPIPTNEAPVLRQLDVRAVLFDIYGTLLISASGDITTSEAASQGHAFCQAFVAADVHVPSDGEAGVRLLLDEISAEHEQAQQAGIDYPEVEIIEMWRRTMTKLKQAQLLPETFEALNETELYRLALEYELRVNPVWPMPNARKCLEALHAAGLTLGIISNAQALTIDLWRVLLEAESSSFVIDDGLQYYSFQFGRAKPGLHMFELAAATLAERGYDAHDVLYLGNDMLNDMMPASTVGFRTALFAGDARSLRRREGDPRVVNVTPDLVITDLLDLAECLVSGF